VKTLLTGEAVTADEHARYAADEDALPALIDTFMASPRFEATLRTFFASAFQQTELLPTSLGDQLGEPKLQGQPQALARLLANLEESFARTALAIVQEGRPFTEVLTTTRFQLSTALLSFLLVIDARHLDDAGKLTTPGTQFDVRTEGEPIPFADSIDPGEPATYRHFTAIGATNGCASTTRTSKSDVDLFELLLGVTPRGPGCNVSLTEPQLSEADFADFRAVDIASLPANGKRTPFFALPTLRGLTSVALSVPRVGFFTTPAFFANWATNDANQHRVTTNQTLIVALGASFDGSDATPAW